MKITPLKYLSLIFFFFLLSINLSFSQTNWQRAYRYQGDLYCEGMCQADNGNYFLLLREGYSAIIYKINSYGDTIFSVPYSSHTGYTCISTDDGGILFTGRGRSEGDKPYSVRLNSQGHTFWDYIYSLGYVGVTFVDLIKTSNSYIAAGEGVLKFSLNGNFIWNKVYPSSYTKLYYSVIEAIDDGYLLAGEVCDGLGQPTVGVITKIDTSGILQWEKRYTVGDPNNGLKQLKVVKRNNTYYAGGYSADPPIGGSAVVTILKLDLEGIVKDTMKFQKHPDFNYFFWDMKFISDNRIVVLYNRHKYYDSTIAAAMIIDTTGNIIRYQEYTGTDYTKLQKIYLQNSNSIFFTGISDHYNIWFDNPFVVRTDSMLYAPPVSVNYISTTIPENFSLKQNYPNPFNNTTQIEFGISKRGLYSLKIYDVTGKLIIELFNQILEPGEYKTNFNASNYSSGMYFYKLESSNSVITKKLVLLK